MKLTTPVEIKESPFKISYSDEGVALGSCFAAEMGRRMQGLKFKIEVNPLGALYNVASITEALEMISANRGITSESLSLENGLYHSYAAYSEFNDTDPLSVTTNINSAIERAHRSLMRSSYLIVTLGTSYIYRLKSSGEVVANCHKSPAKDFTRERLSVAQTISYLERIMEIAKERRVILTISPIRHIKDGLTENSLSKATLRLAIESITERYPNSSYFPSQEIMIDELRDYRFYGEDMLHPSPLAVGYIWQKFQESHCTKETISLSQRVEQITRRVEHRAINPKSPQHQQFLRDTLTKVGQLERESTNIEFSQERGQILNQITQ